MSPPAAWGDLAVSMPQTLTRVKASEHMGTASGPSVGLYAGPRATQWT